jgi:nitroimidazol reductase NimA-like FMN-containing flavoprotein (pyridoxamine 5'-phosphate oxidase superfamily)
MSKTTVWRVLRKRFLVINVCNHGECYETPCVYIYVYIHTYIHIYICVCVYIIDSPPLKTLLF